MISLRVSLSFFSYKYFICSQEFSTFWENATKIQIEYINQLRTNQYVFKIVI